MIRTYRLEDLNDVIALHAELYRRERGYDDSFARFVEEGIREFGSRKSRGREQLWVVDRGGRHGGSIGITEMDAKTAQLRWFLLDPRLRGEGFGREMMELATAHCEANGYERIVLWTNAELESARRLYASFGFELAESRSSFLSGRVLHEERWVKQLITG
ncbi:GNAT family N-acetyltransferase [Saccharibacillus alkalitolerans]|uniref:GNAT family N-acetyltransferase n=1 Tax=Saccharibacillus alkalitolerans TaxID=2705290 RepID=A0ABX0F3K5_9BACL|nr:GNAT family N-acetyltransferase [Saccharibacillus alkalitolerans]NGZ74189.1 GNAT family N-acetyltransferase [Saccharibacillus alkalitolerans]